MTAPDETVTEAYLAVTSAKGESSSELAEVYSLVTDGKARKAVDLLMRLFDRLLSQGSFEICEATMRAIDVARLDTNVLVAVLAATRAGAPVLSGRPQLVARVEKRLAELAPTRVERLIGGLR